MSLPTTFFIGRGANKVLEELILVGESNGTVRFYNSDLTSLVAQTSVGGNNPQSFGFDGEHFYVGSDGYLSKVDTDFNLVSTYGTSGYDVVHVAVTRDHVWYCTNGNDTVYKLSKDFSTISSTGMSGSPVGLSITPSHVIGFSNQGGGNASIHRWDHNFNGLYQAFDVQNSRAGFTDTNYIYNTQQTGDDIVRHTYSLSYNATSTDHESSYLYGLGMNSAYFYGGGNDGVLRRYSANMQSQASSAGSMGNCAGLSVSGSGVYYAAEGTGIRYFNASSLSLIRSILNASIPNSFVNPSYSQNIYSTHQIGGPAKYYDPSILSWDVSQNASNILLPV